MTAGEISSGSAIRGTASRSRPRCTKASSVNPSPISSGVATAPGWMEFTRMPYVPSSAAAALVMPRTAHLLVT